jgi:two-component system, response regulator PdtaR
MEEPAATRHRVLIVEDDPLSARVAEKTLDRLGYAVCAVLETGEAAVADAPQLAPDLVLMDINLAGAMDGVVAARAIIEALGVPVIFLTASVDREIMDRVAETGAAGYIQKPVKLLDLKANLEMALTRRRREHACPAGTDTIPYLFLLETVVKAWGRPLAIIDPDGRVLFASPGLLFVGAPFAAAFPGEPAVPAAADTPCHDASGRLLGWLRLLTSSS